MTFFLFHELWNHYCTGLIQCTLLLTTKEVVRIGYNGFPFPHSYSGEGIGAA